MSGTVRAIRGVIQVDVDDPGLIGAASTELVIARLADKRAGRLRCHQRAVYGDQGPDQRVSGHSSADGPVGQRPVDVPRRSQCQAGSQG